MQEEQKLDQFADKRFGWMESLSLLNIKENRF